MQNDDMNNERQNSTSDHDLLIRIDTKLGLLISQFHEHKDSANRRIAQLEESKFCKTDAVKLERDFVKRSEDKETRLRRIEKLGAILIGIGYVLQIGIGVFLSLYK